MAVEGIANLTPNVANQFYGQTQETPAASTPTALNPAIGTGTEDTFTPSAQNTSAQATAQDAGIFQINQNTLTTAGLNPLLAATATVARQTTAAPNSLSLGVATEVATPLQANSSTIANASQPPGVAPASAQQASSTAANTVEVQNKLRALNAALPALGLTNEQIQQIDRIASLVQNFNPAAYQNLVNQFEAQAEQPKQQNPGTIAASPINAGANTSGFQGQGAPSNPSVPQAAQNTNTANGGGSASSSNPQSAATLRNVEVQFTPPIGSGQPANAPTPQQKNAVGNPQGRAL